MDWNKFIEIAMIVSSILLITVVLLQSGKAESASQVITGGVDLFATRKERGVELVMTRITFALLFIFIGVSLASLLLTV